MAPATHTWTGATSELWSVASNWNGGSPAGDPNAALVFPGSAANLSNTNDLTGQTIQSITFSGGANYTISGNGLTLNGGGITLGVTATTGTDMINLPITLGAIQTWTVTNPSRTLQVAGVIAGAAAAGLTKDGMGTLILTGNNTYSGPTTIAAGSLLVNGAQPASNMIINSGASLGGSGTVGAITANGAIIPGGPGPGILRSGNVLFNTGSSLITELTGTTPGTGFNQLSITGTANLAGSPALTATVGGFIAASGTTFTPITTTAGISGTFSGLADNSTLSVGGRNFSVNYQTNALVLTATPVNTQTILTSSANPAVFGQLITFTAFVSNVVRGANVTPTGTVTFRDGANTLGTATLSSNGSIGTTTFTTPAPFSAGTHSITAVYSGDNNFATSTTSTVLTQTVNQAASTTVLVSSQNPAASGQQVTFMATESAISGATGTPTGTVTFNDGTTTLGTAPLSGGQATFSTSSLSAGTHSITAVYSGDNNFTGNTSLAFVQTISQSATPNQVYVTQLYLDLLRRQPESGGLTFWTGLLNQNQTTPSLVSLAFVNSPEFRALEVQDVYTRFLHRNADPIGLNGWTQYLLQGNTLEQLEAQIVASPEYLQARPGGNQAYVSQLYLDLLRRQPDSSGLTFWTGLLNQNQITPLLVSLRFLNSPEFRTLEVQDVYTRFLHRNADPTGLNGWTQYLLQGNTLEQLEAQIVASPEYLQPRGP